MKIRLTKDLSWIQKVWYQTKAGVPLNENVFSVIRYLEDFGIDLEGFESITPGSSEFKTPDIKLGEIAIGGVGFVRDSMEKSGIKLPEPFDYPEDLRIYLGRSIKQTTIREVRTDVNNDGYQVFMKPVPHKLFNGKIVRQFRDLIDTAWLDNDTPIWISELINFVSEYRFFIYNGKVVGQSHYRGDPEILPGMIEVRGMLKAFRNPPIAYSLDVGVTDEWKTHLIEVNDSYALGKYSCRIDHYLEMVTERWKELLRLSGLTEN